MPSPNQSLATQRPDLHSFEEFDLEAQKRGFIGTRILPIVEVGAQAGAFGVIPVAEMLADGDTRRAPGGGYNRGSWSFEPHTYATQDNGWEEPVDDREAAMYKNYFTAELVAAQRAYGMVLRKLESKIAAKLFNATTFASQITSANVAWSVPATAKPIDNVRKAKEAVADRTGEVPNALVLNWKKFSDLRDCDQIIERINASGAGSPAKASDVTAEMMAQVFDVDQVLVAGAYKNTAAKGQDASLSQIWSDSYAMVCKVATSEDFRESCIGRTFHWSEDGSEPGGAIEEYRDETVRSNIIRVRNDSVSDIIYQEAAQLIDSI